MVMAAVVSAAVMSPALASRVVRPPVQALPGRSASTHARARQHARDAPSASVTPAARSRGGRPRTKLALLTPLSTNLRAARAEEGERAAPEACTRQCGGVTTTARAR